MAAPAPEPPRIRVAAAIPVGRGLIVVTQKKHGRSYSLLPGGGVARGESLAQALIREVREEIGVDVEVDRLLFVNDSIDPRGAKHVVNITFSAHALTRVDAIEPLDPAIERVDVVSIEDLPRLDLRPPIAAELAAALAPEAASLPAYLGPLWSDDGVAATGVDSEGSTA